MKIAVSATGRELTSEVDPRFGRASLLLVVDSDTGMFEVLDNSVSMNSAQGAGIQAAQTVARSGAGVVLTGHCGPKAFQALHAAGIQVVLGASGTVQRAVEDFKAGRLKPAVSADVEGHW